jgi:hypothetical protein
VRLTSAYETPKTPGSCRHPLSAGYNQGIEGRPYSIPRPAIGYGCLSGFPGRVLSYCA